MTEISGPTLANWAAATPGRVACIFPTLGQTTTFQALDRRATQAAQWLLGLGLPEGAVVALLLDNCPALFEMAFAAERAGLYYVPLSTHLRRPEIGYILSDCGAQVVVTTVDLVASLPGGLSIPVVVAGEDYDRILAAQPLDPVPARPIGRPILYSSGTTGRPKGIKRPLHPAEARNQRLPISAAVARLNADAATVYLSAGPLYHAAPHYFSLHVIQHGGTVVAPARFDAAETLALIQRHRITHGQWVPTMFIRMLALPGAVRSRHDLGSLQRAVHAAAPCPIPVKEQMIAWWGPILFEYYSGSESIGSTGIESADWLAHKGSVGRAISGTIHITDETGGELAQGEVGTIWFGGLPSFEYLNSPEKTTAAMDGRGWSTYGDIGHVDANGYLYLSDRRADLILSGGVNVYPQEVETVLARHPAVADAAVVGVPDADLGERVQAVVVLHADQDASPAALIAFCREHLSSVKCPKAVEMVERLPRSEIGKLLRRVLKEQYRAAGGG